MLTIGLIREGKTPADSRVALTPEQCRFIEQQFTQVKIQVQASSTRCYSNEEYAKAGFAVTEDMSDCDVLLGIKEVPVDMLLAGKTYLFFHIQKRSRNITANCCRRYSKKILRWLIMNAWSMMMVPALSALDFLQASWAHTME